MVQGLSDFFKATPPKTFNILCKTVTCYTGWLSIRLHRVHTSLDEYPDPFKGTVKTLTVESGRGHRLQTAHLESRHYRCFARKPANLPNYWDREGLLTHISQVCKVLVPSLHWVTIRKVTPCTHESRRIPRAF